MKPEWLESLESSTNVADWYVNDWDNCDEMLVHMRAFGEYYMDANAALHAGLVERKAHYTGKLYRGLTFSSSTEMDAFLVDPAGSMTGQWASTSLKREAAEGFAVRKHRVVIEIDADCQAYNLTSLTSNTHVFDDEAEMLLPELTNWELVGKIYSTDGSVTLKMIAR